MKTPTLLSPLRNSNSLTSIFVRLATLVAAFKISPGVGNVAFHLAVAYERDGWELDAKAIFDRMRAEGGAGANSLVDSWGYVRWHMRKR